MYRRVSQISLAMGALALSMLLGLVACQDDESELLDLPQVRGMKLYHRHCTLCHGADGSGVEGQYPPLQGSNWVKGDPEVLTQILLHGLKGPLPMEDGTFVADANGEMPAWAGVLDNRDLRAVVIYLRYQFGDKTLPEPSQEDVATWRESHEKRSSLWTYVTLRKHYPHAGGDRPQASEIDESIAP